MEDVDFQKIRERLERRAQRAIAAREEAERLLESRSRDLFYANKELEEKVEERTKNLKKALNEAEYLADAKMQFLANMSHELRTPVSGIIGLLSILKETELNQKQGELIENMQNSAEGLLTTVNDILFVGKLDYGGFELNTSTFDASKLIQNTIGSLKAVADRKKIRLTFHKEKAFKISTDKDRLRQILFNLIGNAIKFTEKGYVEIKMSETKRKSHTYLQIDIKDTGIGILHNVKNKLFSRFSQVDENYSRRFEGSGLGLVITQKLLEIMGGKIWFHSQHGKGSVFSFTLPLKVDQNDVELFQFDLQNFKKEDAANLKVLVAEDNAVNAMIAKSLLSKFTTNIQMVENGKLAVDATIREDFDIILMDINMPNVDGYEATKQIRANPTIRQPIIIAATANTLERELSLCFSSGMNGVLIKPIKEFDFVQMFACYLHVKDGLDFHHQFEMEFKSMKTENP